METFMMWESVPGKCEETPVLEYYPAAEKKTDAAVVIFPGGGYTCRCWHEGGGYADFLNSIGMDAFVCQYRVHPHAFPLPLVDARRAVRYVRANAEKFGIHPEKVAVMGSSAGGHLAALISTYTAPIDFENLDETDRMDCMPNATILCYPAMHYPDFFLFPEMDENTIYYDCFSKLAGEGKMDILPSLSPDLLVKDTTPPTFIWHTSDDTCVNVTNSYMYATALRKHNVPCEMHIFPYGDHGLGVSPYNAHVAQWTNLLKNWFVSMSWLA
ncbi:MAG: alpha/beta hydrolase [Ruminococcaceae bacterium]|nr:alpha/beta hydrolase [Oscillospiraceae bacterium]